jgi:hypothetical protein
MQVDEPRADMLTGRVDLLLQAGGLLADPADRRDLPVADPEVGDMMMGLSFS